MDRETTTVTKTTMTTREMTIMEEIRTRTGKDKGTAIVVNNNKDNKDKGYKEDKETVVYNKDTDNKWWWLSARCCCHR